MASILIDPDDTLQVAFDSGGVRLLEAGTDVLVKVRANGNPPRSQTMGARP